jgi:hypothetical protein
MSFSLVGALACLSESFFAITLVVLFFCDLFDLIQKLSDSELKLRELFLLGNISVVNGMLSNLNIKMNAKLGSREPGGRVGVHADDMFTGRVTCE